MQILNRIKDWIAGLTGSIQQKKIVQQHQELILQQQEQVLQQQEQVLQQVSLLLNNQEVSAKRIYLQELKGQLYRDSRILLDKQCRSDAASVSGPENVVGIELLYDALEKEAPIAFKEWQKLFKNNVQCYKGFPPHSCSVKGHDIADLFRYYISLYVSGRVLDIGCGPQPVPYYLEGYPYRLIAGVDPIHSEHPFEFVHGLAEYLPWPDNSFETVLCATSLEHVLLLDKVLDETHRVLKGNGVFIVWVAFVPGAEKYDPYADPVVPVDSYHLFQFDKHWFEETVETRFEILHSVDYDWPMISSFYVLKIKTTHQGPVKNNLTSA